MNFNNRVSNYLDITRPNDEFGELLENRQMNKNGFAIVITVKASICMIWRGTLFSQIRFPSHIFLLSPSVGQLKCPYYHKLYSHLLLQKWSQKENVVDFSLRRAKKKTWSTSLTGGSRRKRGRLLSQKGQKENVVDFPTK